MKRKKDNRPRLNHDDIEALLCALPLVSEFEADTPEQTALNQICCDAAAHKLENGIKSFSANEMRVLFVAIGFALELLSGTEKDFFMAEGFDPEYAKDLSKYLFAYNRLYPYFEDEIDRLERLEAKFNIALDSSTSETGTQ